LAEFKASGGAAIEVVTGSHTPAQFGEFAQFAREYGLLASRGSDFHGDAGSRAELGALPSLPADLRPVWHDW
jgi:predicted metal-dependent phosphoesterase TrpH